MAKKTELEKAEHLNKLRGGAGELLDHITKSGKVPTDNTRSRRSICYLRRALRLLAGRRPTEQSQRQAEGLISQAIRWIK